MIDQKRLPQMGDVTAPQVNTQVEAPTHQADQLKGQVGKENGALGLGAFLNGGDLEELITKFGGAQDRSDADFLAALLKRAKVPNWSSVKDSDPVITEMINYASTVPGSDISKNIRTLDPRGWRAKLDDFVRGHFSTGGDTGHRDPPTFIKLLFIFAGEPVPEDLTSKSAAELAILLLESMNLDVPEWLRPETHLDNLEGELEDGELYNGEATVENKGVLQIVYTPGGMPEVDYSRDTENVGGAVAVHTVRNPDNELIRALADLNVFHTVVISAHGTKDGILACGSDGMARTMQPTEIAACIADSSIENVVLAACHGETQGEGHQINLPFGGSITIPDITVAQTLAAYGFNVAAFDGPVLESEVDAFLAACAESGAFSENGSTFLEVAQSIDKADDSVGIRTAGSGELPQSILDEIEKLRNRVQDLMRAGALDDEIQDIMDEFKRIGKPLPGAEQNEMMMY